MDRADAIRLIAAEAPVWCIAPAALDAIASALTAGARLPAPSRRAAAPRTAAAVLPIFGVLTHRPGILSAALGLGRLNSYLGIAAAVEDAVRDRLVDRIVLWIDSPGGAALGVEELANKIAEAGRVKPVVAVADVLMASAAFWIGAAAGRVVATPSAEIGSVGAVAVHLSMAGMLDKAGIEATILRSSVSRYKAEGSAFEALSDDARAHFQAQLDTIGHRFVRDLARLRGTTEDRVLDRFGQGRTMFAQAALRNGLIDSITTFQAALAADPARLTGPAAKVTQPLGRSFLALSPEQRRRRLALEAKR